MSNTLFSIGGSSIVTAANDGKTVLKGYEAWDGDQFIALREENGCEKLLAKEDHVYRLLGEHPHILRCYGLVEVHPSYRLNMALGVSSRIAHMHSKNIIHCDISCRNLLLFPDWRVKVGDFGSVRDGNPSENNIVEEIRYELPLRGRVFEDRPYIKRELFALGSAIYEIMAWKMPFEELGTDDVEKKYAAEEFPDVTCVLAGDIIRDCWDEKFETAKDIEGAIKKLQQKRQSGALSKPMDITLDLCDMPTSPEM
ncbi:kinase-like protein [Cadophora sp. DSE1049]|nr:kinase-like protein [Cadophora sp. DSE1049]